MKPAMLLGCLLLGTWGAATGRADTVIGPTITLNFTSIDVPGSTSTQAIGVNNAGQIVGSYIDSAGAEHGFLDSGGVFSTIDAPYGTTIASGINNVGQIVGVSGSSVFTEQNGAFTHINAPGRPLISSANMAPSVNHPSINDAGQIAGTVSFTSPECNGCIAAFLYSNGTSQILPVGGGGVVAPVFAVGINDLGQIVIVEVFDVGIVTASSSVYQLMPNVQNQATNFAFGAISGQASGINNLGQIIGVRQTEVAGPGVVFTNNVATTFLLQGFPGNFIATGINDSDELVGSYTDSNGHVHGYTATLTPEPGSLLLLACGLAGIGLLKRRTRR